MEWVFNRDVVHYLDDFLLFNDSDFEFFHNIVSYLDLMKNVKKRKDEWIVDFAEIELNSLSQSFFCIFVWSIIQFIWSQMSSSQNQSRHLKTNIMKMRRWKSDSINKYFSVITINTFLFSLFKQLHVNSDFSSFIFDFQCILASTFRILYKA